MFEGLYSKVILRKNNPPEEKRGKLVLTLHYGEEVKIGDSTVVVNKRSPTQFKIMIEAPKSISIRRVKSGNDTNT